MEEFGKSSLTYTKYTLIYDYHILYDNSTPSIINIFYNNTDYNIANRIGISISSDLLPTSGITSYTIENNTRYNINYNDIKVYIWYKNACY